MKQTYLIILLLIFCACKNGQNNSIDSKDIGNAVPKLPYFDTPDFTPRWEKGIHKIPEFSFINQNGETITNDTYKDKIYIADFFFTTCPGICPKLTNNMNILQEEYKRNDDVMLLSHTVMPWVDSVGKLKAYAESNNVDSNKWNLVTGDKDALYNIARHGYFADEDFKETQEDEDFIHTENFILVDKEGYIRGVYNGTIALDIRRLIRHIEILENET